MDPDPIDALAIAWQSGDRNAFTVLMRELHGELRLHVSAFCDSREQVDEILQETFVTCFHKIGLYQPRGTFVAWLKAIARNHLINHWRERRRVSELEDDIAETLLARSGLEDLEDDDAVQQRSHRLRQCLDRLPRRSRELIERRHLHQRPLSEMARHFKRTMASLSVSLHRIRQSLRQCLESHA